MAYGAVGAQTFTYWTNLSNGPTEKITNALVDRDGTKMPAWYAMQEVIAEVRAFENVYMNFEWQGVLPAVADVYEGNAMVDLLMEPLESHELHSFRIRHEGRRYRRIQRRGGERRLSHCQHHRSCPTTFLRT